MNLLAWLESTSLAIWVHESPSIWAQPTVMTLHTMGMGILVGASWLIDLRLLGIACSIPVSAFRWVFRAVAVSLAVNATTGVLLFVGRAATWGTSIPFFIKMAFVFASAATLLPIRTYVMRSDVDDHDVTGSARQLAVISIVAWCCAVTAGRLLAYLVA